MPRPVRCRKIERLPVYRSFSPDDITATESVQMTVDEFEALRLLDDEGLTQEACASRMNIARTTVTAIYESARKKVADALVNGKRLLITGGHCEYEPVEIDQEIIEKGTNTMRIAVTYENGEIFQHFGHTEQFKLYDAEEGKIVNEQIVDTNGSGHGALAGFLQAAKADALICGGIGMGAQMALADAGISSMPVYRDQRMLRRNLLLRERLNMIRMPNATTMVIITAKGMSAVIIMVKDMTAVIITEKTLSVVIITGKVLTAVMKRVMRAAAAITASKPAVRSAV